MVGAYQPCSHIEKVPLARNAFQIQSSPCYTRLRRAFAKYISTNKLKTDE